MFGNEFLLRLAGGRSDGLHEVCDSATDPGFLNFLLDEAGVKSFVPLQGGCDFGVLLHLISNLFCINF